MPLVVNESAHIKENAKILMSICPFNAFDYINSTLVINDSCRVCMQCVKEGPKGAIEEVKSESPKKDTVFDKSSWVGIAVVADFKGNRISTATYELLGKARELSQVTSHPVQVVVVGSDISEQAEALRHYADEVYVYDYIELKDFIPQTYSAVICSFIENYRPSTVLVTATSSGRSLAPRVAAAFKTGLTADCTKLTIKPDTDLVQIRPAFGGNIMAEIITANTRPQLCTVRAGIFEIPEPSETKGKIYLQKIPQQLLSTECRILQLQKKPEYIDIADAQVIVAAGRGIKNIAGLTMIEELAKLLNAQTASTRPLVENGWFNPRRQIGLSGRTVRPKLIITCGISGSVQFAAGMSSSDRIIAINTDINARIFNIAHYGVVGDVYEVVPKMISLIKGDAL